MVFSAGANGQLTVESDATLDAAPGNGSGPSVVGPGQVVNEGMISVEQGATLEIQASLDNTGSLVVAAGGVLDLQTTISTDDLDAVSGGGQLVLSGELNNTGSVLDLGSFSGFSLSFGDGTSGGAVNGGTLATAGAVLEASTSAKPTMLDGVVVTGPLDFDGSVEVTGGTSFVPADGTPGSGVTVENGTLTLDGYGTLDGLSLDLVNGALTATAPTVVASDVPVTVSGKATVDGSVTVAGTINVAAGDVLTVQDGSTAATTVVVLGNGATLEAARKVAGVVQFAGPQGRLELSGSGALSATLG